MVIRRAVATDAEALAAIGAATFGEAFGRLYPRRDLEAFVAAEHSVGRARRDLADPGCAAWLVEADGRAVGLAVACPCGLPHPEVTAACGEIKRLYVLNAWQGGGTGSRLLEAALAWLEREGPRLIWLSVFSENVAAQRLYARFGFEKVGNYHFAVGDSRDPEFILRRG
ncbi:MAG: GNAT family N-acetyltransferase [Caulobacteraceae bacterium]|nr:GNAT family N-acetyltransferase [Caulobacteraceae bacterium]